MKKTAPNASLSEKTVARAQRAIAEGADGARAWTAFFGPAVVASVAYVDPGNFAANVEAGAKYGYELLWVVVLAGAIAMLFQALSAKLGIVTGRNLAEVCRERFPRSVVWAMWFFSEIAAMATDLAEFIGGALGFSLLFHIPPLYGAAATAVLSYLILAFEEFGFRPVELIIGFGVSVIGGCYLVETFLAPIDWRSAIRGAVSPQIADTGALTLAVAIIGATVMPHAIYLHSGLTQSRIPASNAAERRAVLRFSNIEVAIALGFAGLVNMAMVMMASSVFHSGHTEVASIETAYQTMKPLLSEAAAAVFLTALIASGVSSSAVGTMAGQMIMQGFAGVRIPLWLRRLITMAPAVVAIALGVDATRALIFSQVVLSLTLPLPMIALVAFTRRRDVMGELANGRVVDAAATAATGAVLALNVALVAQTLGAKIF